MSVSHKLLNTKEAEKMFSNAFKKSAESATLAFEDITLLAHETAVKRSNRVVLPRVNGKYIDPTPGQRNDLRPFQRTGNYRRSIKFKFSRSGGFKGVISAGANYSKKLEQSYFNLKESADLAVKQFPKIMERNFKQRMRKNR